MSRIGKVPIVIPEGVKLSCSDGVVTAEGPKGTLTQELRPEVSLKIDDGVATVEPTSSSRTANAYWGLYRTLINNMVVGTSKGFKKALVINGVGFRAEHHDTFVLLNLGYSSLIEYDIPEGITVAVEGTTRIEISGPDKALVGQTAAEIRGLRPPEPYKGKGVRYENEVVRRKVGKSGTK